MSKCNFQRFTIRIFPLGNAGAYFDPEISDFVFRGGYAMSGQKLSAVGKRALDYGCIKVCEKRI
jgi:hypothetical protein